MGRDKKSAQEKKLTGNPGKRPVGEDYSVDLISDPSPPEGMDEKQVVYWNRYAPYMVENGLLTNLNMADLEHLCFCEAQLSLIRDMLVVESRSLLQEKKNYHGDVVDLVEGVYSKLLRNYTGLIRTLKADLRIRTDKMKNVKPKEHNRFDAYSGKTERNGK